MTNASVRLLVLAAVLLAPVVAQAAVTLTAKDLYGGFDARRVLLDDKGVKLTLDARAIKSKSPGIITTDPIDLVSGDTVIGTAGSLSSVDLTLTADVPDGAKALVEARSGADMFDTAKWSDWVKLTGLTGKLDKPAGRYVQVRITLTGTAADKLPSVSKLELNATVTASGVKPVAVVDAKIQKISRSPIDFSYERPDAAKLVAFRKAAKLDEAVAGAKDDFEKLVKLMYHVGSFHNDRTAHKENKGGVYQWDIDAVFEVKDGKPTVYGHCMTYSETLVTAATAMGYVGSRHMAIMGFREASHEVCDIWVPSLGKWVYFDPSLTQYYFDKATNTPLNLIEMHNIVASYFVPPGKDMNWFSKRSNDESKAVVREVGGQKPIGSKLGPWKYGDPMPADYDWGWSHGYLAAGFVQMTPRNDFNSNPKVMPRAFGNNPGYLNFPFWVDAKTPPRGNNWYTRLRDFYWTLDQASVRLVQTDADTITVELGQSMPFFKAYQIKVDGKEVPADQAQGSTFTWKLKAGENKLEVAPKDDFGKVGLASSVVVKK
ncbi:MAG: hypothetical protein PHU85_05040 [Phycisphaerae bacterium]|nr:hypothetical protein [Phycisphaerae bacterium]